MITISFLISHHLNTSIIKTRPSFIPWAVEKIDQSHLRTCPFCGDWLFFEIWLDFIINLFSFYFQFSFMGTITISKHWF